jgi:hypothetical protein
VISRKWKNEIFNFKIYPYFDVISISEILGNVKKKHTFVYHKNLISRKSNNQ